MSGKAPGRVNFEAYDQAHGVRSPSTWDYLGSIERAGFDAGAQAVLDQAFPGLRRQLDEARDQVRLARAEVATVIASRAENDRQLRLAIEQARGAGEETAAELDRVKGLLDDFTHAVIDLGSRPAVIEAAHAVRKTAGLPVVDQFSKLEEQR